MDELTGFQRDLLVVVAGLDRPSGQEIKTELEGYYGREINHGRLYPNLDAVVAGDYVDKGQRNRRTNYYELTESGDVLLRKRRRWENRHMPWES